MSVITTCSWYLLQYYFEHSWENYFPPGISRLTHSFEASPKRPDMSFAFARKYAAISEGYSVRDESSMAGCMCLPIEKGLVVVELRDVVMVEPGISPVGPA